MKGIWKDIKTNFFSYFFVTFIFILITSIGLGMSSSYSSSKKNLDFIMDEHNMPHYEVRGTGTVTDSTLIDILDECVIIDEWDSNPICEQNNLNKDRANIFLNNEFNQELLISYEEWIVNQLVDTFIDDLPTAETLNSALNLNLFNLGAATEFDIDGNGDWVISTSLTSEVLDGLLSDNTELLADSNVYAMSKYVIYMMSEGQVNIITDGFQFDLGYKYENGIYLFNENNNSQSSHYNNKNVFSWEINNDFDNYQGLKLIKNEPKNTSSNNSADYGDNNYFVNDYYFSNLSNSVEYIQDTNEVILNNDQIILNDKFMKENKLKTGDTVTINVGYPDFNSDVVYEQFAKSYTFTIVGEMTAPSYLNYYHDSPGEVRDYSKNGYALINDEIFNEILLRAILSIDKDIFASEDSYDPLDTPDNEAGDNSKRAIAVDIGYSITYYFGLGVIYYNIYEDIIDYFNDGFSEDFNYLLTKINIESYYYIYSEFFEAFLGINYSGHDSGAFVGWENYFNSTEFYGEGSKEIYDTTSSLADFETIVGSSGEPRSPISLSYYDIYQTTNTIKILSWPMAIVFLLINIFIIFIFMKRIILNNSKEIATSKALGYRTSYTVMNFLVIPVSIIIFGFLVSILNVLWLQIVFTNMFYSGTLVIHSIFVIDFLGILFFFILPIIIISFLIFLYYYVFLKNNTFNLLQGELDGKPNFMVRGWSKITVPNFVFNYRIKNILRAFGKSSIVLVITLTSFVLLSSSISFGEFKSYSQYITSYDLFGDEMEIVYVSSDSYNSKNTQYVDEDEMNDRLNNPSNPNYYDGGYTFSDDTDLSDILSLILPPDNCVGDIAAWSNNVGTYMEDTNLDNKYIHSGLGSSSDDGYLINMVYTRTLVRECEEVENNPMDDPIVIGPNTYSDVSINDVASVMTNMFLYEIILKVINRDVDDYLFKITPNIKVITDVYLKGFFGISIIEEFLLYRIYDENAMKETDAKLQNENQTQLELLEYQNNLVSDIEYGEIYIPSLISISDIAIVSEWNEENIIGEIVTLEIPATYLNWDNEKSSGNPNYTWIQNPSYSSTTIYKENGKYVIPISYNNNIPVSAIFDVEIIGIYESYIPMGLKIYAHDDVLGSIIDYSKGNVIATKAPKNDSFEYSNWWSNEWEYNNQFNEWYLLDESKTDSIQPINSFSANPSIPIGISTFENSVINSYTDVFNIFLFLSIITIAIAIFLIMFLVYQSIMATKKESSTLKSMGYGNFRTSSLIIDGNIIVIAISAILSLPISLLAINYFNLIFSSFFIKPAFLFVGPQNLFILVIALLLLISVIYLFSYILLKKISPLLSLKYN